PRASAWEPSWMPRSVTPRCWHSPRRRSGSASVSVRRPMRQISVEHSGSDASADSLPYYSVVVSVVVTSLVLPMVDGVAQVVDGCVSGGDRLEMELGFDRPHDRGRVVHGVIDAVVIDVPTDHQRRNPSAGTEQIVNTLGRSHPWRRNVVPLPAELVVRHD